MRTCNPDFETLQQSRCNTLLLMRLCFCCLPGETLHVFCCPFSSPHHHHLQYLSPHAVVFLLPSRGDLARFVLPPVDLHTTSTSTTSTTTSTTSSASTAAPGTPETPGAPGAPLLSTQAAELEADVANNSMPLSWCNFPVRVRW